MKKLIAVLLVSLCAGAALSAQVQISAGVGGSFTAAFGGGGKSSSSPYQGYEVPYIGSSIFAFFDATYVEASLGLFFGTVEAKGTGWLEGTNYSYKVEALTLGLLGKYPFDLGFMTLFPAIGIEGMIFTKGTIGGANVTDMDKLNHLWIKFGVGADFSITEQIYIRGTALYGIRLESKFESSITEGFDPVLGHGIQIKAAVGYKF